MKRLLILFLILITPGIIRADGVDELRKAIDYEFQKVRSVPPISQSEKGNSFARGQLLKKLGAFGGGPVGFRPIITTLPAGVRLPVGVVVSADRRYVRIGLSPIFSSIGEVHTFNFGR